jgi:hypothetical protein
MPAKSSLNCSNKPKKNIFLELRSNQEYITGKTILQPKLVLLGLLFYTGTIQMPHLQDYWKSDPLFKMEYFSSYMSRNRSLQIFQYLHFATNPKPGEPIPGNQLVKIKLLLDLFNIIFDSVYYPRKYLSHVE